MRMVAIGHDRDLFRPDSISAARHLVYGRAVGEVHAVVFVTRGREAPAVPVRLSPEVTVYAARAKSPFGALWRAWSIARSLVVPGETVLSAQDPFEAGLVAYLTHLATGVPFEVQEHGDFFSAPHWRRESRMNRVRYLLGLFILRRAQGVRVVSRRIADTLARLGVEPGRIRTLPVYVDASAFARAQPDPTLAALRPSDGLLLLTMARLVPQKDLGLLIRSFAHARTKGLVAHLAVIGRGPEDKELRELAERVAPGHVTFRDWTDAPASAMRAADVYVISSKYEGWARVLVEALAAGVPVVTTDVGCAGEVVLDGVTGLVVPVGDEAAFTHALLTISGDGALRARLGQAGPPAIATLPTLDESAARMSEALHTLLSRS